MALKATIFKLNLNIADMDRHYYADHNLTLARHPSETDLRMMIRIAAFALNANEQLSFTKGLSSGEEPEVWEKSLSDEIEQWIELGQPDEKRLRQACGKAKQVKVYTYQEKSAQVWRSQIEAKLSRFNNLQVVDFIDFEVAELEQLAARTMNISAMIQDGELSLNSEQGNIVLPQNRWLEV